MSIEIKVLNSNSEPDYLQLLVAAPAAMFNHSLNYRKFLQKILNDAEDHYLLGYEHGELTAALPLFVKYGCLGPVVNSLPFYGSHGGLIAKPNASRSLIQALLIAFADFCDERQAICSTLIESPIGSFKEILSTYHSDYYDDRIGQITTLPEKGKSHEVEESLLSIYHPKTRNIVRKSLKAGFLVSHDGSQKTFKALHALHKENIQSIGGTAKPWSVFLSIKDIFKYDEDYRVYTATHNGQIVCALLIFYFKGMVEYFTPATLASYRRDQPLSLLIFTAMRDAILERGSKYWNWGGTWLSQDGVYKFKSRWGTEDYPYKYYITNYNSHMDFSKLSKTELLKKYQYFYTLPFNSMDLL